MTRDEKRIAIAQACGWYDLRNTAPERGALNLRVIGRFKERMDLRLVPDYFGSLDAMHEAEKMLKTANNHALFRKHLEQICADDAAAGLHWSGIYVHATAKQRAEALGLALGLWKEEL